MKIIQSANNLIDLVIGKRKYEENVAYRALHYLVFTETEQGKTLVFNNLTKAMVLLDCDEYRALKENDFSENKELKVKLVEMLFLVEEFFNEKATSESVREISKNISNTNEITSYTILPTTSCNARCFYCYEAGTKFITMDAYTADAVAKYIIKKSNGKKVYIQWFGGEPLCNIMVIDRICNYLLANNVSFQSTMTTNGYLFDEKIIRKAVDLWNLRAVQITLDGLADTYNKVKNYINDDTNAFEKVINNIEKLSKSKIRVRIRLNMDYHNSEELYQLADLLHDRFEDRKNIALYVMPLYENVGYKKTVHDEIEREELFDSCIKLTDYFLELGFSVRNYTRIDSISTFACQADNPTIQLILPNGDLGFCEHYLENDSFSSVFEEKKSKPFWCDYRAPIEKCNTCAYYPTCLVMEKCGNGSVKCNKYTIHSHIKSIEYSMQMIYNKWKEK